MTNKEIYEKYGPEEGQRRIDAKNAKSRDWREKHPDYFRQYQDNHREQINATARKWQSKHREAQQKRMNDYHGTLEGKATNLLHSYKQADRDRRGNENNLTRQDIINKVYKSGCKCVYCESTKRLGLDRVSQSYPHDVYNTVCCCYDCNMHKASKTLEEWLETLGMSVEEWIEKVGGEFSDSIRILYPEK